MDIEEKIFWKNFLEKKYKENMKYFENDFLFTSSLDDKIKKNDFKNYMYNNNFKIKESELQVFLEANNIKITKLYYRRIKLKNDVDIKDIKHIENIDKNIDGNDPIKTIEDNFIFTFSTKDKIKICEFNEYIENNNIKIKKSKLKMFLKENGIRTSNYPELGKIYVGIKYKNNN